MKSKIMILFILLVVSVLCCSCGKNKSKKPPNSLPTGQSEVQKGSTDKNAADEKSSDNIIDTNDSKAFTNNSASYSDFFASSDNKASDDSSDTVSQNSLSGASSNYFPGAW